MKDENGNPMFYLPHASPPVAFIEGLVLAA